MIRDIWDRTQFFLIIMASFLVSAIVITQGIKAIDNALELRQVKREKVALEQRVRYLEAMVVDNEDGSTTIKWKEGD